MFVARSTIALAIAYQLRIRSFPFLLQSSPRAPMSKIHFLVPFGYNV